MEYKNKPSDTRKMSGILAELYNNRLQLLLKYTDFRFTKELTNHFFASLEDLSDNKYAGDNFAKNIKSYISTILGTPTTASGDVHELADNIELYTRNIIRKYGGEDMDDNSLTGNDYRKIISMRITRIIQEKRKDEFPEGLDLRPVINQIRMAVEYRNTRSHPQGHTPSNIYKGYECLRGYHLLLGYLLYGFYHMVLSGKKMKYLLTKQQESVQPADSVLKDSNETQGSFLKLTFSPSLQYEWWSMKHIYADYLLKPHVRYIFGDISIEPGFKWSGAYQKIKDEINEQYRTEKNFPENIREIVNFVKKGTKPTEMVRKLEAQFDYLIKKSQVTVRDKEMVLNLYKAKEKTNRRRERIRNEWAKVWCNRLLDFFELRLCRSQKNLDEHLSLKEKYGSLFLSILKLNDCKTVHGCSLPSPVEITERFIQMLTDYLSHSAPVKCTELMPLLCLKAVRKEYNAYKDNPEKALPVGYVDFEGNRYTQMLMDLMEKLAAHYPSGIEQEPTANHFLGLSDYLTVLPVYVYMTEVLIHEQDSDNSKPADFVSYMTNREYTLD